MTEPEKRMRAMLEKTGLYFGEDKWFSAELAAYAKGLELVYDTLSHVRRDAFVQTAEEDGLKAFESLFRVVPSVDSMENRRAMLLTRGAVTPADHTVEAMQKQLLAAGINGKLVPQKGGVLNINVLSTMGISEAAAESEARAFLPAHLSLVFDFGKNTWDAQDAAGSSWNVLDLETRLGTRSTFYERKGETWQQVKNQRFSAFAFGRGRTSRAVWILWRTTKP